MQYVLIGNSAAGTFAAERIRRNDPSGSIDILSAETFPAYARCMTSYYLTGKYQDHQLLIRDDDFYVKNRLNLHLGERCEQIDLKKQQVLTDKGRLYTYDKLLLATGGYAVKPDIEGADKDGVFVLRTLADAKNITSFIRPGAEAVVIGGGFVSLKAAYALLERGVKVTCIITSGQILSRILDAESADQLATFLIGHGLQIEYHNDVTKILGNDANQVNAVLLKDGRELKADFIIIGKGVNPCTGFLQGSGIEAGDAIATDVYLRTSAENIYAAGDCIDSFDVVERVKRNNALWPNAAEQGKNAADNMCGKKTAYPGSIAMNAATFFGRAIVGAGMIKKEKDDGYETVCYHYGNDIRRRFVFRDDVLVGYYLMGDIARAGILTNLLKNRVHLGQAKKDLTAGNFHALLRYTKSS